MPLGTSATVQELVISRLEENDCELIAFKPGRKVEYKCSCGNTASTYTTNVRKPTWGGCAKCSNQRSGNKNDYEFARKVFEEAGETLPPQEYKGNKTKLSYTCSFCGEEAHISLNEFRRGRRCEVCSKERAKVTNIERYGVENPFQAEVCKEKMKRTSMERYGHEHHLQNPEIFEKALRKTMAGKYYTFPSGRKEHCQGYEPRCLDILLDTYDEDDILVKRTEMPSIWYPNPKRMGKKSLYYPDMYIPSCNIVVEVKSVYTLDQGKDSECNYPKFLATAEVGYDLHLYVFNHKDLLYRKVFTKGRVVTYPHPPAELVVEDD